VRFLAGPIEADLDVVNAELACGGFEGVPELFGTRGQASVPFFGFGSDVRSALLSLPAWPVLSVSPVLPASPDFL
jgi:hypothetical protein